jgi:hypothetical protein
VRETVEDGVSGVFFDVQSVPAIIDAVRRFEQRAAFCPRAVRANAEHFSTQRFREDFARFVLQKWTRTRGRHRVPTARHEASSAA